MRYFIAFVTALGLLFLLILLLFHSGGKPKVGKVTKPLASYSTTDAVARLTIDGPVNADSLHDAVRITVGKDDVTYEQIQGYQNTVVNTQSFANNENAYVNFLLALQHAGFTQGDNDPKHQDARGYCPLGQRYIFQLNQNDQELEHYWATSCGSPKTYVGVLSLTLTLFQAQVPNYNKLTQNLFQ
jgi:hypothetical protein